MHWIFSFPLLALGVFTGTISACRDWNREGSERGLKFKRVGFFAHQDACTTTGGRWAVGLQTCFCPERRAFSAKDGCLDVSTLAKHKNNKCVIGDVLVSGSLDYCAPQNLDVTSKALRGIVVAGPKPSQDTAILNIGPLTQRTIDVDIRRGDFSLLGNYVSTTHPVEQYLAVREEQIKKCVGLVRSMDAETVSELCDDLGHASALVVSPDFDGSTLFDKHVVPGDPSVQLAVANFKARDSSVVYRIVGVAGMPMTRDLIIQLGDRVRLDVLLSPLGTMIGGRLEASRNGAKGAHMLMKTTSYFDATFEPIAFDTSEYGNVKEVYSALEQRASRSGEIEGIPTDGAYRTTQVTRAMLFEESFDPRLTKLFRRFRVDDASLHAWLTSESHPSLFMSPSQHDIDGILDVVASDPYCDESHAGEVASLLAAGLISQSLSLFPLRNGGLLTDPRQGQETIMEAIRRERPRVVNISVSLASSVGDCDAFFGPILDEFVDSTLFVAAAGNDGARDVKGVCPAELGSKYGNLISVAGTEPSGRLHPSSNYGRGSAQIAAPFCQSVISNIKNQDTLKTVCGTSFAAPIISNGVLHALANFPELSPITLKEMLMASCGPDGLDVACGGAFNQQVFWELARHGAPQ